MNRAEVSSLIPSVRITSLLGPHYIPSTDCGHYQECDCLLEFDCPLCQIDSTNTLAEMEAHYWSSHWNRQVEIGKFTLFPCGLLHASSSRISCMVSKASAELHYHCPVCVSSTFTGVETLRTHCSVMHGERPVASVGTVPAYEDMIVTRLPEPSQGSRIRFSDTVHVRQFSLALSICEQAGGRSEAKRVPVSFASFVALSEISEITSTRTSNLGCAGRNRMQLFKGFVFLVCGTDVPPSALAAIYSLGGTVSGAGYPESEEWERITHVLLGNRIGAKSVRNIKQNELILWVSSDWIRNSVEQGTIFREDLFFNPLAIDRFFAVRDANARADRPKSRVRSPNITLITSRVLPPTAPRMSPPVISSEPSFLCTPIASPMTSAVIPTETVRPVFTAILTTNNFMKPPLSSFSEMPYSEVPQPSGAPLATTPLAGSGPRMHLTETALRRSKRLSVAPRLWGPHSPIHKP